MTRTIEVGDRFERLTVAATAPGHKRGMHYHCVCDCGERRIVYRGDLLRGATKSCGCLRREMARQRRQDQAAWLEQQSIQVSTHRDEAPLRAMEVMREGFGRPVTYTEDELAEALG